MKKLDDARKSEGEYFDGLADLRRSRGIPCEADMHTDTLFIPRTIDEEIIDAKLKFILLEPHRTLALKALFGCPEGIILDVCCGPGWFCLEGARHGRNMIGYDISKSALELADSVYNSKRNGKQLTGDIKYYNESIEDADLSSLKIGGAMGWSAFHHLSDPGKFLDNLYENIERGGVVVTMDDLESDKMSKLFRYILKFIFPIYEYTYWEKVRFIFELLFSGKKLNKMEHSPMEIYADKHGAAADIIRQKLTEKFTPIYDKEFGAFSIYVCHSLKGPAWWRHSISKLVVALDKFLILMGVVSGSYRIIVAKK